MSEIQKFEGDMFWDASDTEDAVYDPEETLDDYAGNGGIVEFEQAKRLPNFFGVLVNGQHRFFTTRAEAEEAANGK